MFSLNEASQSRRPNGSSDSAWKCLTTTLKNKIRWTSRRCPSLIDLLLPTRQRPKQLRRLVDSINATASHPETIRIVTYIDDDDHSYDDLQLDIKWVQVRGPRERENITNLSLMWNLCYEASSADLIMHCGDDIVFRTPGWDGLVRNAFDAVPDKILFAFGRDGYQDGNNFGTHGFIHRKWVETAGFLFPPLFVSDYNDTFLNDVSKLIGRHREIDIYTEHLHYIVGKAEVDQNTRERLARHQECRPDLLYNGADVQDLIKSTAEKLREVMQ